MRKVGFCLAWLMVLGRPLLGQITVEIVQDQDQFLPGETMPTAVRITNRSGQTLRMGGAENWLTFTIESAEGMVMPKTAEVPVVGEFVLESSKVATKRVDLEPYFVLNRFGHYTANVTVRIPGWDEIRATRPRAFDLIEGTKLWEQQFGVPNSATASNGLPEIRKYTMQEAIYLRGQIRLYLRLSDASGRNLRVVCIGSMLSWSRPEFQVDKFSNLHILYENGPHSFAYLSFNPDGEMVARRAYDFRDTRARLGIDEEGKIFVAGGARRLTPNDIPPSEPPLVGPPSSAPGSTNATASTTKKSGKKKKAKAPPPEEQ
jgi:hypothetical protein